MDGGLGRAVAIGLDSLTKSNRRRARPEPSFEARLLEPGASPPVLVEGLVGGVLRSVKVVAVRLRRELLDRPALAAEAAGDVIEPLAVHAKVGLPDARARAQRDDAILVQPLRVVYVALLQRLELRVNVVVRLLDDLEAAAVDEPRRGRSAHDR